MPILSKTEIQSKIDSGELIIHALRDSDGNPVVEPASYDLRAGVVIWKDPLVQKIQRRNFDPAVTPGMQMVVTLSPGQMIFVITHEELMLPEDISGTVYSRNRLQKENILALNAGHVDPGFEGPIMIRLINLGSSEWTLPLGEPVFTVVFHTIRVKDGSSRHGPRTKDETIKTAMRTAAQAFSNPFHDLYRNEINKQLAEYYSKVESDLRTSLSKEFFRHTELSQLLIKVGALLLAGVYLFVRIPWDKVLKALKFIMGANRW
jgi:deoxycytidine triphosphate deaminase